MGIFDNAIEELLSTENNFLGPISFKEYLRENNLNATSTAAHISIDSLDKLDRNLKDHGLMVLRLGNANNPRETSFLLIKTHQQWKDYFLFDDELKNSTSRKIFIPEVPQRELFPFQLLPKLTESSLVNLAIGSGLLSKALNIDPGSCTNTFSTGQSTFTFDFKANSHINQPFTHKNGQVEIDAILLGKVNEIETLIIIEAKHGKHQGKTLAKHKLFYAIKALENSIPEKMPILPVYLKTWSEENETHFLVTKCSLEDIHILTSLKPEESSHLVMPHIG